MKTHLNTLFVTLDKARLRKDGEAVAVRHEGATKLRVPLHNLDGIVTFGWDSMASASLLGACSKAGVTVSFCTPHGGLMAGTQGFTSGNVLLRREQYRRADDLAACCLVARNMIAGKLANSRTSLRRTIRDHGDGNPEAVARIEKTIRTLENALQRTRMAVDLDSLRGIEGEAAAAYFAAFPDLITNADFSFPKRSKRPPMDTTNCLLSFLYAMLAHDCRSACEASGLDAAVGFLHRDRPGRPGMALDLMEEFRPFLVDRLVLSLINRRQVAKKDFKVRESGAVEMKDKTRKEVLIAYQKRKQEEIRHSFLDEKVTIGLLPHLQARLLNRHLRGDLDAYPPFLQK